LGSYRELHAHKATFPRKKVSGGFNLLDSIDSTGGNGGRPGRPAGLAAGERGEQGGWTGGKKAGRGPVRWR